MRAVNSGALTTTTVEDLLDGMAIVFLKEWPARMTLTIKMALFFTSKIWFEPVSMVKDSVDKEFYMTEKIYIIGEM